MSPKVRRPSWSPWGHRWRAVTEPIGKPPGDSDFVSVVDRLLTSCNLGHLKHVFRKESIYEIDDVKRLPQLELFGMVPSEDERILVVSAFVHLLGSDDAPLWMREFPMLLSYRSFVIP